MIGIVLKSTRSSNFSNFNLLTVSKSTLYKMIWWLFLWLFFKDKDSLLLFCMYFPTLHNNIIDHVWKDEVYLQSVADGWFFFS